MSQADFEAAVAQVKTLSQRPSNEQLLSLYGLYKQSTEGDVTGKRPGRMNFKGRAKYDAWDGKKGMSKDDAMVAYIKLVGTMG